MYVHYPIAWFKNVYDTEPKQELVTLQELTRILTHFELKPQVLRRMTREIERTKSAWKRWERGEAKRGKRTIKFQKAAEKAEDAGEDPQDAARAVFDKQIEDARRNTKREMRLWSPALFDPEGRRESEDVICMSALVLDYDDGTPIRDATEVWGRWYHIVHTTWSHTAEWPKFRIIFPLMDLVPANEWEPVYAWAEKRAIGVPDHTKKGIATTFALPTIGSRRWPREAFVHQGELLDPVSEGLVPPHPPVEIPTLEIPEITLKEGDPEATYVEHLGVDPHAWGSLEDDDIWSGGAVVTGTATTGVVESVPPEDGEPREEAEPPEEAAVQRDDSPQARTNTDEQAGVDEPTVTLEHVEAAFRRALHERQPSQLRDGLARLRALHQTGTISEEQWHRLARRIDAAAG